MAKENRKEEKEVVATTQKKITEKKSEPNMAIALIKKVGVKNLLKIGGGTVAVAAGATVVFPFFGAIMIFGLGVGCMAVIGAVVHAYNVLRKNGIIKPVDVVISELQAGKEQGEQSDIVSEPVNPAKHKVWDTTGKISVFTSEPSLADLMSARNTSQEDAEDLFCIESDTLVTVINDNNKHAVKVRIGTGKHQGRVGWICRSLLVKEEKAA